MEQTGADVLAVLEMNMSESDNAPGRLIPASVMEFSRYAKNLAWLLEAPLHIAQEFLARCYGYANVHEIKAAIPEGVDRDSPTGPFEPLREFPPFFAGDGGRDGENSERMKPLTAKERRLLNYSLGIMRGGRPEKNGRLRRRHFAVLECGFFSVPSVHRKAFAQVKAGIIAMEKEGDERERYIEKHWPPRF